MSQFGQITPAQLFRLVGTPDCPLILGTRTPEDLATDPRLIPTARHLARSETVAGADPLRRAVVSCTRGRNLSEGAAALSVGPSRMFRDDLAQLEAGMALHDALYRWARDGFDEGHDWPAGRPQ